MFCSFQTLTQLFLHHFTLFFLLSSSDLLFSLEFAPFPSSLSFSDGDKVLLSFDSLLLLISVSDEQRIRIQAHGPEMRDEDEHLCLLRCCTL